MNLRMLGSNNLPSGLVHAALTPIRLLPPSQPTGMSDGRTSWADAVDSDDDNVGNMTKPRPDSFFDSPEVSDVAYLPRVMTFTTGITAGVTLRHIGWRDEQEQMAVSNNVANPGNDHPSLPRPSDGIAAVCKG